MSCLRRLHKIQRGLTVAELARYCITFDLAEVTLMLGLFHRFDSFQVVRILAFFATAAVCILVLIRGVLVLCLLIRLDESPIDDCDACLEACASTIRFTGDALSIVGVGFLGLLVMAAGQQGGSELQFLMGLSVLIRVAALIAHGCLRRRIITLGRLHDSDSELEISRGLKVCCNVFFIESSEEVCCICLEGLLKGEVVSTLQCGHSFHKNCLDVWLAVRPCCPVRCGIPFANEPSIFR